MSLATTTLLTNDDALNSGLAAQQSEPCAFRVRLHSVVVSDLKTRHRFGEELRCALRFQQDATAAVKTTKKLSKKISSKAKLGGSRWERVIKTEYKESHGGDCIWSMKSGFTLQTPYSSVANVSDWLRDHFVTVSVYCKHDSKDNKKYGSGNGEVKVDLFTCATGAARHNLPLKNNAGEELGRIEFTLEMQQETAVTTRLSEVKARNLNTTEKSKSDTDINAYLKYGYSLNWPDGHRYSRCREKSANPSWVMADLPALTFRTTLDEMLSQSIFVHVTDAHDDLVRGEKHTPLGEMKFVFRAAIESKGEEPIDSGGIQFRSPLTLAGKRLKSTLEGVLTFDNIPRFAQMKVVNVKRVPIHTEQGIVDGAPLFPWVVMPDVECFLTGGGQMHNEAEDVKVERPFSRSATPATSAVSKKEAASEVTVDSADSESTGRLRSHSMGGNEPVPIVNPRPSAVSKRLDELTGGSIGNLISFSPQASPVATRKKSAVRATAPAAGRGAPLNLFGGSDDPFTSSAPSQARPSVASAPASTAKASQDYNPFA